MTEKEMSDSLELFSHKLKNALHSVGINVEVLKTKIRKKLPGETDLQKHLEIIKSETERLNTLSMLFLKYLQLPENKRHKTDLRALLEGKGK